MQARNPIFRPNKAPASRLNTTVPGMHHASCSNE